MKMNNCFESLNSSFAITSFIVCSMFLMIGIGYVFDFYTYAETDDGSIASFSEGDETDFAPISWNFGSVHWMEGTHYATGTGVVKIIEPDMNLNPREIDIFDVDVWSKSDTNGITLAVTETGISTGVFEGTVFFTTAEESSGHKLRVAEGDGVTVRYKDDTLPSSYTRANSLDISSNSKIKITQLPPLKQYESGVPLERIQCNRDMVLAQKEGSGNPACVNFESLSKLIERGWILGKSLFNPKIIVDDILMQYDESYSKAVLDISLEVFNPNNVAVTLDKVKVILGRHDIRLKNDMDYSRLDIPAYSSKTLDASFEFAVDKYFTSSDISDMKHGKPGFNTHGIIDFDSEKGLLKVGFGIFGKEFMRT